MNVVVLAAGTGSRLRPYTNSKPKALVELAGKPLLEHQLDVFSRLSISDVSLVTGYLSDHFSPYNLTQHINPLFDQSNLARSYPAKSRPPHTFQFKDILPFQKKSHLPQLSLFLISK